MDGAGAGGAAPERRKQLTAAEAVNHKRQLAQMVERELALTGADSVTDFDDALQMVLVETAFGRYPKHLLVLQSLWKGSARWHASSRRGGF